MGGKRKQPEEEKKIRDALENAQAIIRSVRQRLTLRPHGIDELDEGVFAEGYCVSCMNESGECRCILLQPLIEHLGGIANKEVRRNVIEAMLVFNLDEYRGWTNIPIDSARKGIFEVVLRDSRDTAMQFPSSLDHLIQFLLSAGLKLSDMINGETVLGMACSLNPNMACILLRFSSESVDCKDEKYGRTPLSRAISCNNPSETLIIILIHRSTDLALNARSDVDESPIFQVLNQIRDRISHQCFYRILYALIDRAADDGSGTDLFTNPGPLGKLPLGYAIYLEQNRFATFRSIADTIRMAMWRMKRYRFSLPQSITEGLETSPMKNIKALIHLIAAYILVVLPSDMPGSAFAVDPREHF